jgi:FkbM family methyltransferase
LSLKSTTRRWARRLNWILFTVFDLQLQRRSLAEHADVFGTLRSLVSDPEPVILDVGARGGGTVFGLHELFPAARIDCFEPSAESFKLLQERFHNTAQVRCVRKAVTDRTGVVKLNVSRTDSTNSLLKAGPEFAAAVDPMHVEVVAVEEVPAVSLDDYCRAESIEHVSLLKLDIQGAELLALKGAEHLLADAGIDLILTEVCFTRLYEGQALVWDLREHLERRGYALYGLYDLTYGRNGMLAWGDGLFVSPPVAERLNQPFAAPAAGDRSALTAS